MKRHVLAGRYGLDDQLVIPVNPEEQLTNLQLVAGERTLDHGVGAALTSLKALGVHPTESGIDLAIIAAHVHAVAPDAGLAVEIEVGDGIVEMSGVDAGGIRDQAPVGGAGKPGWNGDISSSGRRRRGAGIQKADRK